MKHHSPILRRWFGVHDDLTSDALKHERDLVLQRAMELEREARLLADEAAAWRNLHGPLHGHRDRATRGD